MAMVMAIVSDFKLNKVGQSLPTHTTHQPIKICLEQTAKKTTSSTSGSSSPQTRVIVKTTIDIINYHYRLNGA